MDSIIRQHLRQEGKQIIQDLEQDLEQCIQRSFMKLSQKIDEAFQAMMDRFAPQELDRRIEKEHCVKIPGVEPEVSVCYAGDPLDIAKDSICDTITLALKADSFQVDVVEPFVDDAEPFIRGM